jgi:hypothetical protein
MMMTWCESVRLSYGEAAQSADDEVTPNGSTHGIRPRVLEILKSLPAGHHIARLSLRQGRQQTAPKKKSSRRRTRFLPFFDAIDDGHTAPLPPRPETIREPTTRRAVLVPGIPVDHGSSLTEQAGLVR